MKGNRFEFMSLEKLDEDRLEFIRNHASDIYDLTVSEAKFVDEISENPDRKLSNFERHSIDRMMVKFRKNKRR